MIVNGIALNLLIGAGTLIALWLIYLWKRNPAIVDLGWAIGLSLMGLVHHLTRDTLSGSRLLTSVLVLLWGVRLAGYLFWTRIRLGKSDARYESLQNRSSLSAPMFFLFHYMVQACFQAVVGIVFIFTASSPAAGSLWTALGLLVWWIGYLGSIVADRQLHEFRRQPHNRGKVCRVGLWNYSRHPNYFFEILLWFGFSCLGLNAQSGWLGLISPLTLLLTMRYITGPISERQSLQSKPEAYRDYQDTTSMIIPWFKNNRR